MKLRMALPMRTGHCLKRTPFSIPRSSGIVIFPRVSRSHKRNTMSAQFSFITQGCQLLTKTVSRSSLLHLLFRYFTSWALRIIPKLFLRDMHRCLTMPNSSPPLKTAHYSPMLHNALLAVATAFSDNPAIKDPATRQRFADKAKSCLESECEMPKLSAMTALSILANYHSSTNHPTLGYIYFGMVTCLPHS